MRGVWALVVVAMGCGAPVSAPSTLATDVTVAVTDPTTTTSTVDDGIDERSGTFDGRTWQLRTRVQEGTGDVCLDLWWEGETDHWQNCYALADYPVPLVWTSPIPPSSGRQVAFVLGFAPAEAASVEVRRGDVVMGTAAVFPDGDIRPDLRGFALPLEVTDAQALSDSVVVPGVSSVLKVGLRQPMTVIAANADGAEVARQGPIVGPSDVQPVLVVGDGVTASTIAAVPPGMDQPAGFWTVAPPAPSLVWLVVAADVARVEMVVGELSETHDVTRMADVAGSPPRGLVAYEVPSGAVFDTTFTLFDGAGAALGTVTMAQFYGD